MKKFIISLILVAFFAAGTSIWAQENQDDRLGLPGDNLNLYAVMKLFQESKTLEGFERSLNDENSRINNLDLNGDNLIDYIKVNDFVDGNVHNIVLQVAINERENQDVAVFTVQRLPNGQVQIQLTGDEELYGRDYIIEPIFDDDNQKMTPNPGYLGGADRQHIIITRTSPVLIASWPVIRFIYSPHYVIWHSSWHWSYYPPYWHPWHPLFWHNYYGYHYNWYNDYYGHYRRWNIHRYNRWNDFYFTSRRSYSPHVYANIKSGNYRNTYSHPEQRRDGEAMFIKTHPGQGRRSTDNSGVKRQVRRSGSQSTMSNNSGVSKTRTTQQQNNTGTNRAVTNRSSNQNTGTTRRSAEPVNKTSVSVPATEKNVGPNRSSGKSTKKGVSSPKRRTVKTKKDEKKQNESKDKKESQTDNDSSRR